MQAKSSILPNPVKTGFCYLSQEYLLLTQAWNIKLFGLIWKMTPKAIHRYENLLNIGYCEI